MNKFAIILSLLVTSSLQALPSFGWDDLGAGLDVIQIIQKPTYSNTRKLDKSVTVLSKNQKKRDAAARKKAAELAAAEAARQKQLRKLGVN
jgi:hypothetical protein